MIIGGDKMSKIFYEDRKDIPEEYTWDLRAMYKDDSEMLKDLDRALELADEIATYSGKIGDSKESLLDVLKLSDDLTRLISKAYSYSSMNLDQDTRNGRAQELKDKALQIYVKAGEKTSFLLPELLSIDENKIKDYIESSDDLRIYKHFIEDSLRNKKHVLSMEEETLLAQMGEMSEASQQTFAMLNNADLKFPSIKNEEGQEVEITQGNFIPFMRSKDRRVRKDAYEALYTTYDSFKNTFAQTLGGEIKKNIFNSRVRNYDSSLKASLFTNNVDVDVYENLIDSVHENLDAMHKYMDIRKRALGLEELRMYDIYTPMVQDFEIDVEYEEAKQLMLEGLDPLGKEYLEGVEEGLKDRWIDVYENAGKRSGAYSSGTYDSKPYILLNYQNQLDDVFTLVHEMGHSMHSYLTRKYQPAVYGSYSIFVAEVASTTNEALLLDYLLKNSQSKEEKLYLLNHYLEQFRGTVFRQTMFAEFEKIIYEHVENGGTLTPDYLSDTYKDLNIKYYGDSINVDDYIAMEWARIPHFYYNYYVFQYATGYSAAISFSQKILNEGQESRDSYLEFLKSGSSDYPIKVLKKAGVDMTTKDPVNNAMKIFRELVDEMDKLI